MEQGGAAQRVRWEVEPVANPEEQARSAAIDEQLRSDRLEALRARCSVVILSPASAHANAGRHAMAASFARSLGASVDASLTPADAMSFCGTASINQDQQQEISGRSYPCARKNKGSQVKLAAEDPSVLVYVVSVDCSPSDSSSGEDLAKSLSSSLAHLLFAADALGQLDNTAVCLVLANCAQLRSALGQLRDNAAFHERLRRNFVGVKSQDVDDVLLGVAKELEAAAQSCRAPEVRTVLVEEVLQDAAEQCDEVAAQMLQIVRGIQAARLRQVETADMASGVHNARKPSQEERQAVLAQRQAASQAVQGQNAHKERQVQQQQQQQQKHGVADRAAAALSDPTMRLALFGAFIAVITYLVLQMIKEG